MRQKTTVNFIISELKAVKSRSFKSRYFQAPGMQIAEMCLSRNQTKQAVLTSGLFKEGTKPK